VYREGYALVLSAALSAGLGLVYWLVAARAYSPEVVGLNAAAISTMMLASGIAQLNLVGALLRFVPGAGRSTWRLVGWSYATSVAVAAVVAAAVLAIVRQWVPALAFLSSDEGFALWFVAAVMVWCVFSLQDAVLTGLRRAIWVPVDNVLFAVAKIGLLVGFTTVFPRTGIFASWTLGVVLSVLAINALLVLRLIPGHVRSATASPEVANPRRIGRFVAADYAGGLSWIVATTVIPLLVIQRLGAAENAYYALGWVITMPLYLVSASTASSLVVALVDERTRFRDVAHRVFAQTARLVVPAALLLAAVAPVFLRLFGPEYAHRGTTALRLLALSSIPAMVTALYTGVWRAQRRLPLLVWVRCVQYAAVVLLSLALVRPYGIAGPALAWLAVQTIGAAVLFAVWPRTFVAERRSGSRWRLRGIRVVRNIAADTGLLAAAQTVRGRPLRRRRLDRTGAAVPRILAKLPESGAEPPPSAWTAHELRASVTERLVVVVGPPGSAPRAVVKLAESDRTARSLVRETEVLSLLSGDTRLGAWRALLPEVLAAGEIDGEPFRVEGVLPGVDASRAIVDGSAPGVCLGTLAAEIEKLHGRTGRELEVDAAIAEAWVDAPVATLELHARRRRGAERWQLRALDRLRGELHEALDGARLTAGWIHGDYVPGNILVDPATGAVSGIVDWELAGARNLQALDLVQLVLTTRALLRRREYGEMVLEALASAWTDEERSVLDRGAARQGATPPLPVLVRLAWLRHTHGLLIKTDRYAASRLWHTSNFEAPLAALA